MDCVCIFDVPLTTVTAPAASIIFSLGLVEGGRGGEGCVMLCSAVESASNFTK